MNKFLVLALSLLIGGLGCYANTLQDTTIVVNNAKKVTIEKKRNSMAVKVEGSDDNPDYFYSQRMEVDSTAAVIIEEKNADWDFNIPFINKKSKTKKYHGNLCVGGFGFGVVSAMDPYIQCRNHAFQYRNQDGRHRRLYLFRCRCLYLCPLKIEERA